MELRFHATDPSGTRHEMVFTRYYGANATRKNPGPLLNRGDERLIEQVCDGRLKARRGSIAGQITDYETRLRRLREAMAHINDTLRLFDDEIEPDSIAPKKPYRRVKLFGQGELNRLIFDAMRKGGEPMSTPEIARAIVEELGHGEEAQAGMVRRVRANLQYLCRDRKLVRKHGERFDAKWSLVEA